MKKFKFSLLLAVMATNTWASDYTFRETKTYRKAFKVEDGVSVDVSNKYGQVIFTNWDKDSVLFEVEVSSEADKLDRVLENLDGVDVSFTGNKIYVEARTNWMDDQSFIRKSVNDIRRSLSGSVKMEINYHVYLPEDADVNVENRFGDVYLTDMKGVLTADISHGNLRAGNLNKIRRLKLRYGDLRLKTVNFATIDAGYGDIEIETGNELRSPRTDKDPIMLGGATTWCWAAPSMGSGFMVNIRSSTKTTRSTRGGGDSFQRHRVTNILGSWLYGLV